MSYSFRGNADELYSAVTPAAWTSGTYALGDKRKETATAKVHVCTTAGTSGGSEPTWTSTTIGDTTTDGGVTWTYSASTSKGMLASSYEFPISIGFWAKRKTDSTTLLTWPISTQWPVTVGRYGGGSANANGAATIYLQGNGTSPTITYTVAGYAVDSAGGTSSGVVQVAANRTSADSNVQQDFENVWFPVVTVFAGSGNTCTSITTYVPGTIQQDSPQSSNTISRNFGGRINTLFMGESMSGGGDYGATSPNLSYLAHVCLWNAALNATEAGNFCSGTSVDQQDSVIAYAPLTSDLSVTLGLDSVTTLTAENAQLDSGDNPTVSYTIGSLPLDTNTYLFVTNNSAESNATGSVVQFTEAVLVKKLKVLVRPTAAAVTGVSGIVWENGTGGEIAGTEIGEFTNKAFETATEGSPAQAVLKVPAADFGGSALTVSSTVKVLARTSTYTTGIISGTIIEE